MHKVSRPRAWKGLLLAASVAVMALVAVTVVYNLPTAANAASVSVAPVPAPVVKPIVALPVKVVEPPAEIELPPQQIVRKQVRARTAKKPAKLARRTPCNRRDPRCGL
jgi:hypothetical protein